MPIRYQRSAAHLIPSPVLYRDCPDPLPTIVTPLLEAQSEDDLRRTVSDVVRELGFDTFTYGAAIRLKENWEPWFTVWTTMSVEWVIFYTKANMIEIDPRIHAGFGKPTPLFWDRWVLKDIPRSDSFFAEAERFGLRSGIGFGLSGDDFEHYMVSFNSSREECSWITDSTAGRAYIFAAYFHRFYRSALISERLKPTLQGYPLTARELECLELVAKGFTNPQIANVMKISERTVAFHISHFLAKMRCENRTEAVAVALQRGILPPRRV